jgi:hypothetical protein
VGTAATPASAAAAVTAAPTHTLNALWQQGRDGAALVCFFIVPVQKIASRLDDSHAFKITTHREGVRYHDHIHARCSSECVPNVV